MTKKSQTQRILELLKRGDSISDLEAYQNFHCRRLSGRIFDLRHGVFDGTCYEIESKDEPNADGGRHARYQMKLLPSCLAWPRKETSNISHQEPLL
jgi:hypothetical protein